MGCSKSKQKPKQPLQLSSDSVAAIPEAAPAVSLEDVEGSLRDSVQEVEEERAKQFMQSSGKKPEYAPRRVTMKDDASWRARGSSPESSQLLAKSKPSPQPNVKSLHLSISSHMSLESSGSNQRQVQALVALR